MADYAIHEETLRDIAGIIRKKDGTQAGIDPATYADRVNLMGMLEEKTASGEIATFDDGADDVPLKSYNATITPTLTGTDEINVEKSGKNLLDYSSMVDGYVNANGTFAPYHNQGEMRSGFIKVKPNTQYHLALVTTGTAQAWVGIGHYSEPNIESFIIRTGYWSFTTGANTNYVVVSARNFAEATNCQLELGAVTTEFEPYTAPESFQADLGRTVNGGSADIVNGTGEAICGKKIFDGSENWTAYTTGNGYVIPLSGMKRGTWYTSNLALSYPLPKAPNNDNLGVRIGVNNDGIYVVQANTIEGVTDLASFKEYLSNNPLTIIYPLADPEEFTFDQVPINSKAGVNNFWADTGDSEIKYRSNGAAEYYPAGEEVSF